MTNVEKLKEKINESGYKLTFIASKVGLTYQGFLNKVNGESEFKASEIKSLCELLHIDIQEKEAIFFE